MSFKNSLNYKLIKSLSNDFGIDNFDELRFGEYSEYVRNKEKKNISLEGISNDITVKFLFRRFIIVFIDFIFFKKKKRLFLGHNLLKKYFNEFDKIWINLNPNDKKMFISLLAYRILGYKKIKLARNNKDYWDALLLSKKMADFNDVISPNFLHFILKRMNLESIGIKMNFYFYELGLATDFLIEQYAYKLKNNILIEAEVGDTVLDLGGCWGDTALYFAHKVGVEGKVYSFEFIPNNIILFDININMNPIYKSRIDLIKRPVSNKSDETVYYQDNGPGSSVRFSSFEGQTGTSTTISIDDFVKSQDLQSVDFIKMDIEGAEIMALEGAMETIKMFKPKLAIAIYHSLNDMALIPNLLLSLGYEIYLGHYTIHSEETICFAIPKKLKND